MPASLSKSSTYKLVRNNSENLPRKKKKDKKNKKIKEIKEIAQSIPEYVNTKLIKKPVDPSKDLIELNFNEACKLPPNARICYILNTMYYNKTKKKKMNVMTRSAFFKRVSLKNEYVNKERKVNIYLIVRAGKNQYYIQENNIKAIYVYKNQDHLKKIKVEKKFLVNNFNNKKRPHSIT